MLTVDRHIPSAFKIMPNGDLRVLVETATGQLKEVVITKTSGNYLGFDSNGNPVSIDPTTMRGKAGSVAVASTDATGGVSTAGSKTIVFAKAYPTGTKYVVQIHFNGLTLAYNIDPNKQTEAGFTFTYLASINGTAYWSTTVQSES